MPSLKDRFDELIERIRHGRDLNHASFEPIYYLVFPPEELIDVKRSMPALNAKLRNSGWTVHRFSVAEHILDLLRGAPLREIWMTADKKNPLDWVKSNQSLANALASGALGDRLKSELEKFKSDKTSIILVTDLEALHPYLRIGVIESQLYGQFHVPTVFFYPGTRTGKTRLKFLGFYPEDGNYRSVHVGG